MAVHCKPGPPLTCWPLAQLLYTKVGLGVGGKVPPPLVQRHTPSLASFPPIQAFASGESGSKFMM